MPGFGEWQTYSGAGLLLRYSSQQVLCTFLKALLRFGELVTVPRDPNI